MTHEEKALTIDTDKLVVSRVDDTDTLLVGAGIKSSVGNLILRPFIDSTASILLRNSVSSGTALSIDTTNLRVGVGAVVTPTAALHLPAGTATVPPLKFTTGIQTSAVQDGAIEYHSGHLYFSHGLVRYQLDQQSASLVGYTNGAVNYDTALGVGTAASGTCAGSTLIGASAGASATVTDSVLVGYLAGRDIAAGTRNVAVGVQSLEGVATSITDTVAIGYRAGFQTELNRNVFVGSDAGGEAVTAQDVVHIGYRAGWLCNGPGNVVIGSAALSASTLNHNGTVAIGYQAGRLSAPGGSTQSVLVGYQAGEQCGTATSSVFIGASTGRFTTGGSNTFVGTGIAQTNPVSGGYNVVAGTGCYSTGATGSTGSNNIAIGRSCIATTVASTTFSNNIAIGVECFGVGNALSSAQHNIAMGYQAGRAISSAQYNIAIGAQSGRSLTSGAGNVAMGVGSLFSATSGGYNVAIGLEALYSSVADTNLTAVGYQALYSSTTKSVQNVAVGYRSLYAANGVAAGTAGYCSRNTALGYHSLRYLSAQNNTTDATDNTAVGNEAAFNLGASSAGNSMRNTVVGASALFGSVSTRCTDNSMFGYRAGFSVSWGNSNVGVGSDSLYAITYGSNNVAVGARSLSGLVSGQYNTAIGVDAGRYTAVNHWNTAIGSRALYNNVEFGYLTAVGGDALWSAMTNVAENTAIGYRALFNANGVITGVGSTCQYNTAVGFEALLNVAKSVEDSEASDNTAVGRRAAYTLGLGQKSQFTGTSRNTVLGSEAMYGASSLGSCNDNTFVGYQAGFSTANGGTNNAVGSLALRALTSGSGNVAMGYSAGSRITTGASNVALGYEAMAWSGTTITGSGNVAIGTIALERCSSGANNVAIGSSAGALVSTGNQNVLIGNLAGNTLTTGYENVFIGRNSQAAAAGTFYAVAMGQNTTASLRGVAVGVGATANAGGTGRSVAIGAQPSASGEFSVAIGYLASATASSSGQMFQGTCTVANNFWFGAQFPSTPQITVRAQTISQWSDRRAKKDIESFANGLEIVNAITPRIYRMQSDTTLEGEKDIQFQQKLRYGFIAQEIKDAFDSLGVDTNICDDRAEYWALDYMQLIAPLVQAVQALSKKVSELEERLHGS